MFETDTSNDDKSIKGADKMVKKYPNYCKFKTIETFTDHKCTKGKKEITDMQATIGKIRAAQLEVNKIQESCVKDGSLYFSGECTESAMEIKAYTDELCVDEAPDSLAKVKASNKFKDIGAYVDVKFDYCIKLDDKKFMAIQKDSNNKIKYKIPVAQTNNVK